MPPESTIQWNRVTWYSKTLSVVLFVVLVYGAFFFSGYYQQQKTPPTDQSTQQTSSAAISYKQGFYGEIPSTWSAYSGVGNPAKTLQDLTSASSLAYSFAPHQVSFGDGAFEQVDFYYLTKTAAQALIDQATKEKDRITTEDVGGFTSTVIHYPTDNGQVDKDGSGGEDYLIGYPGANLTNYLLMRNWSLGNSEFEAGFRHFLQTAQFQSEG